MFDIPQLFINNGGPDNATVTTVDGKLQWTITVNFTVGYNQTYVIRTRTANTSFTDTDKTFTVDVLY